MRIAIYSDIHLEFAPFDPGVIGADVVVLAGDIHVGDKAIKWAQRMFASSTVIYVLGNHEYYGEALPKLTENLKAQVRGTNVHVLENDALSVGDTLFLGCSLWTDFALYGDPRIARSHAAQCMSDYQTIRVSSQFRRLRTADTAAIHAHSRRWLQDELEKHRGARIVVVTHHAPSMKSVPQVYVDDLLTAAFASNLDTMVGESGALLWIHGHTHGKSDYRIGGTRVICNPRGYPGELKGEFDPALVVTV